jgi:hypothetical protein
VLEFDVAKTNDVCKRKDLEMAFNCRIKVLIESDKPTENSHGFIEAQMQTVPPTSHVPPRPPFQRPSTE